MNNPDVVPEEIQDDDETSSSGFLSDASRAAAVSHALRFVATYRSRGAFSRRMQQHVVSTGTRQDPVTWTSAAILLRVYIAAAESLLPIVSGLSDAPTFQYRVERTTSAGSVAGRLDVRRYYLEKTRITVPRSYPVRRPVKDVATPENVLAVRLAEHVRRTLTWTTAVLGYSRVETDGRTAADLGDNLKRVLGSPSFQGIVQDLRRHSAEDVGALTARVRRRLETGRISRPRRYEDLLTWVAAHPLVGPGNDETIVVEASHLDSDFDTRLFELWLLQVVADAATKRFGPPIAGYSGRLAPTDSAVLSWKVGSETLAIYYQAGLARIFDGAPRWRTEDKDLQGYPDLTVKLSGLLGSSVSLVDAKLRQRPGRWPTEEIYKLLGYFGNAGTDQSGLGGIVFHAPTSQADPSPRYALRSTTGTGRLLAVGLDPADGPAALDAVGELIDMLVDAHVGQTIPAIPSPSSADTAQPDEAYADLQQRLAAATLTEAAKRTSTLESFHAQLRDVTGGRSEALDPGVREMLTSSLMFGQSSIEEFDASGAILTACNGIERILRHDYLGSSANQPKMLGNLLGLLNDALRPDSPKWNSPDVSAAAAASIGQVKLDRLRPVLPDLEVLKNEFRNPSAHEGTLGIARWVEFYALVFRPSSGLLTRLTP